MRLSRTVLLLTSLLLITPAVRFMGDAAYGNPFDTESASSDEPAEISEPDSLALVSEKDKKPEGKRKLLFTSNRTGNYEIWLIDSDGNYLKNLTNDNC